MKRRLSLPILALILVSLVISPDLAGGASSVSTLPPVQEPEGVFVVRVYYRTVEDIRLLTGFDVFEYNNRKGQYFLVAVDRAGLRRLEGLGLRVVIDSAETANFTYRPTATPEQISGIPGYTCYRTVEETFQTAQDIVAAHPDLATWSDVGDSWERSVGQPDGYDMMVLRLTNSAIAGDKPKLFITASIHAREYTPAELTTRFAEYLIDNYGVDADATWLLDHHEVHLMFQANPDGRKEAEAGYSWRKNTNENYCGVTSTSRGADLNRNFSFYWNFCAGCSSGVPCDETYRGPSPASEPETQAIQNYLSAIFPDQRADDLVTAAPADATGVYLDLHSYSELVLWPWGFTTDAAPNATALQTLGRKFAYFNSYTPQQAYQLYGTDGTTDDYGYGHLGVPSYTFELGTAFFQACSTFENTIVPTNLPALVYAAKTVRTPYQTPAGPDALSLTVAPAEVAIGDPVTLTATINDTRYFSGSGEPVQNIAAAEYYIDVPPWQAGAVAYAMAASDGSFNNTVENVTASVNTASLAPGRHIIFMRGQDANGNWGAFSAVFLTTHMFTVTPASLAVCIPANGAYTVNVGYADTVTLDAAGNPVGTTATFSVNPVSGPGTTTLTIDTSGGPVAGDYTLNVMGSGGGYNQTTPVQLSIGSTQPGAATLIVPADGSTGVAIAPMFTWDPAADAASYDIEVATDPSFTSIVASAYGLTGASFTPAAPLAMDAVHYWRVRSNNLGCRRPSAVHAFRTAATGCVTYTSSDVPKTINDRTTIYSTLNVPDSFTITDVNVNIGRINHTYDDDLDIYLLHPDNTKIMLSTDNGGDGDNYVSTVFDDEAATAITAGAAPFTGSYQPERALSGLDGKTADGAWTLRIYDDSITDPGTLQAWSLTICGASTSVSADYSDLAGSYGIAWHAGTGALRLGANWTADASFAEGADADDGVSFVGNFAPGRNATARVNVQGAPANGRWLRLWFDWNSDGVFDADERVVNAAVADGDNDLLVPVPAGLASGVNYRARLYDSASGLSAAEAIDADSYGGVTGGEVEDGESPAPNVVDLVVFTATAAADSVMLAWETVSETYNAGFNVYRSDSELGSWVKLNATLIPAIAPGSSGGHAYTWIDPAVAPGATYWYMLEDVALDGASTRHAPVQATVAEPNAVGLSALNGAAAATPALVGLAALIALAVLAIITNGASGGLRRR